MIRHLECGLECSFAGNVGERHPAQHCFSVVTSDEAAAVSQILLLDVWVDGLGGRGEAPLGHRLRRVWGLFVEIALDEVEILAETLFDSAHSDGVFAERLWLLYSQSGRVAIAFDVFQLFMDLSLVLQFLDLFQFPLGLKLAYWWNWRWTCGITLHLGKIHLAGNILSLQMFNFLGGGHLIKALLLTDNVICLFSCQSVTTILLHDGIVEPCLKDGVALFGIHYLVSLLWLNIYWDVGVWTFGFPGSSKLIVSIAFIPFFMHTWNV